MKKLNKKLGFTVIELLLSLIFISFLSISVASIIAQITRIYRQGILVKEMNSSSTEILNNIENTIHANSYTYFVGASSTVLPYKTYSSVLDRNAMADYYADSNNLLARYQYVKNEISGDNSKQLYGAVCFGEYSYVWNSPEILARVEQREYIDFDAASLWQNGFGVDFVNDHQGYWIVNYGQGGVQTTASLYLPRFAIVPDPGQMACREDNIGLVEYEHTSNTRTLFDPQRRENANYSFGNRYEQGDGLIKTIGEKSTILASTDELPNGFGLIVNGARLQQMNIRKDIDYWRRAYLMATGYQATFSALGASEFLRSNDLAIYEFSLNPVPYSSSTKQALFSGYFIMGTEKSKADIYRDGDYCLDENGSFSSVCIVRKYAFAIKTGGDITQ